MANFNDILQFLFSFIVLLQNIVDFDFYFEIDNFAVVLDFDNSVAYIDIAYFDISLFDGTTVANASLKLLLY